MEWPSSWPSDWSKDISTWDTVDAIEIPVGGSTTELPPLPTISPTDVSAPTGFASVKVTPTHASTPATGFAAPMVSPAMSPTCLSMLSPTSTCFPMHSPSPTYFPMHTPSPTYCPMSTPPHLSPTYCPMRTPPHTYFPMPMPSPTYFPMHPPPTPGRDIADDYYHRAPQPTPQQGNARGDMETGARRVGEVSGNDLPPLQTTTQNVSHVPYGGQEHITDIGGLASTGDRGQPMVSNSGHFATVVGDTNGMASEGINMEEGNWGKENVGETNGQFFGGDPADGSAWRDDGDAHGYPREGGGRDEETYVTGSFVCSTEGYGTGRASVAEYERGRNGIEREEYAQENVEWDGYNSLSGIETGIDEQESEAQNVKPVTDVPMESHTASQSERDTEAFQVSSNQIHYQGAGNEVQSGKEEREEECENQPVETEEKQIDREFQYVTRMDCEEARNRGNDTDPQENGVERYENDTREGEDEASVKSGGTQEGSDTAKSSESENSADESSEEVAVRKRWRGGKDSRSESTHSSESNRSSRNGDVKKEKRRKKGGEDDGEGEEEEKGGESEESPESNESSSEVVDKKRAPKKSQMKRGRKRRVETEESDEDEDDDADSVHAKRRRGLVDSFFLQEAEVGEEEDEDSEDKDWLEQDGVEEAEEAERAAKAAEGAVSGSGGGEDLEPPMPPRAGSPTPSELEAYVQKRYGHYGDSVEGDDDEYDDDDASVVGDRKDVRAQRMWDTEPMLPTTKGPFIWAVRCLRGREGECVLKLMRKHFAYVKHPKPIESLTVTYTPSAPGWLYVEAMKADHVKMLLAGVSDVRSGFCKQKLVPLTEMTDVFRIKAAPRLEPGQWVRPRRGLYGGDIAQVVSSDEHQQRAVVRLLPRLPLGATNSSARAVVDDDYDDEDDMEVGTAGRGRGGLRGRGRGARGVGGRRRTARPPAKPFDVQTVWRLGGHPVVAGDTIIYEKNNYKGSFLHREYPLAGLHVDGVTPTASELDAFREAESVPAAMPVRPTATKEGLTVGDMVGISYGELEGLKGRIINIKGPIATVKPISRDLTEPLRCHLDELHKVFLPGVHVRVVSGTRAGATGMVMQADALAVVLIQDHSMDEIIAKPMEVQVCDADATCSDNPMCWGDLVRLRAGGGTFGVVGLVWRLAKDSVYVVDANDTLRSVKPRDCIKMRVDPRASALDSRQNRVGVRDLVRVVSGPREGRKGSVRVLWRDVAFIASSPNMGESVDRWLFAARCTLLLLETEAALDERRQLDALMSGGRPPADGPRRLDDDENRFGPRFGRYRGPHARLIGRTVRVLRGPYKGQVGTVRDATKDTVELETHSSARNVSVGRLEIQEVVDADMRPPSTPAAATARPFQPPFTYGGTSPTVSYAPTEAISEAASAAATPLYSPLIGMHGETTPGTGSPDSAFRMPERHSSSSSSSAAPPATPPATPAYSSNELPSYVPRCATPLSSVYNPGTDSTPLYSSESLTSPPFDSAPSPSQSLDGTSSPNSEASSLTSSEASSLAASLAVSTPAPPSVASSFRAPSVLSSRGSAPSSQGSMLGLAPSSRSSSLTVGSMPSSHGSGASSLTARSCGSGPGALALSGTTSPSSSASPRSLAGQLRAAAGASPAACAMSPIAMPSPLQSPSLSVTSSPSAGGGDWLWPGVEVLVDSEVEGEPPVAARVREALDNSRVILIPIGPPSSPALSPASHPFLIVQRDDPRIRPMPPNADDTVVIVGGLYRRSHGRLYGVKDGNGLVRLTNGKNEVIPMNLLARRDLFGPRSSGQNIAV